MTTDDRGIVTRLLQEGAAGQADSLARLLPLVYRELRVLAASRLRGERRNHTLQPTALVHEAYMRLVDQQVPWQNRAHFFAVAAQAMRRVVIDYAVPSKSPGLGEPCPRIGFMLSTLLRSRFSETFPHPGAL